MELMVPDDVKRAKEVQYWCSIISTRNKSLTTAYKKTIPFLTAAEGLGSRTVIGNMKSQLTGHEMIIEDVPDSDSGE